MYKLKSRLKSFLTRKPEVKICIDLAKQIQGIIQTHITRLWVIITKFYYSEPTYDQFVNRIRDLEYKFISQHITELTDEFVRIEQQLNGKNLSCPEQVSMNDLKSCIEPLTMLNDYYYDIITYDSTAIDKKFFVIREKMRINTEISLDELHRKDTYLSKITDVNPVPRVPITNPTTTMNRSRLVGGKQRKTKRRRIKKTKRSRRKY